MKDVIIKNKALIYVLNNEKDMAEERLNHLENGCV